ncbi:MAG TPA: HepT-like ribonuclease domain-containing protein [Chitinophagales bacterium]|nr:HepT-like ribonuclease domain-containing protein [Chitinophagales bacterium]
MSEELIRLYLLDIKKEIDDIGYFTDKYSLQMFLSDIKTQKAVIMSLLNIGELVKKLPYDFTQNNKQIQWYKIAGLRNRIAHDYPGLDIELIWNIIQNETPLFRKQIEEILV